MSWAAVAKSATAPAAPSEAPAPSADERIAVIDTNAIISGLRLEHLADRFCTIPEVLAEVRDKQSRTFLSTLPFSLDIREPTDESIRAVQRFARETGDIHSLSAVDLKLLALAHTLELVAHGSANLREHPVQVRTRQKHKTRPRALPGWGNVANPEEWKVVDEAPEELLSNAPGGQTQSRIIPGVQSLSLGDSGPTVAVAGLATQQPPAAMPAAAVDLVPGEPLPALPLPPPPQQQQQQLQPLTFGAAAAAAAAGGTDAAVPTAPPQAAAAAVQQQSHGGHMDDDEEEDDEEEEEDDGGWETAAKSRNAARRKQRKARRHQAWLEAQQQQQHASTSGRNQAAATPPPPPPPPQQQEQQQQQQRYLAERPAASSAAAAEDAGSGARTEPSGCGREQTGEAAKALAEDEGAGGGAEEGSGEDSEGGGEGEEGEEEMEEVEGLELVTDEEYEDGDGAASEAGTTTATDGGATAVTGTVAGTEAETELLPNTTSNVFTVTADFAMQNVMLQMGLRLVTRDGKQITRVSRWALRCSACSFVTKEAGRLFCPRCGNMTMDKVEVTVGPGGAEFFGVRKKFILRGTRFSLPKPKSGRAARSNPVLREDVLLARTGGLNRKGPARKKAPTTAAGGELDPFAPEFGSETWHQANAAAGGRAGGRRGAPGVLLTSWKHNPNEAKPQRKSRRK